MTHYTYQPGDFGMPHPCATCGRPTIFWRCDACVYGAVDRGAVDSGAEICGADEYDQLAVDEQPTVELPAQPHLCGQSGPARRRLDELVWLADIGELGGPLDGDEFHDTLRALETARTSTPPAQDWSGLCLWCARELREGSGADETPLPALARMQPCLRHRKAGLALLRHLRNEDTFRVFCEAFGFGPDGRRIARRDDRNHGGAA